CRPQIVPNGPPDSSVMTPATAESVKEHPRRLCSWLASCQQFCAEFLDATILTDNVFWTQ
ncbi:UNVERIFIED_CONTAM: hypothetical protein NY603_26080, partial [Bacteroidetes bacterium 56_B9]